MIRYLRINKIGMYGILLGLNGLEQHIEYFKQYEACVNLGFGYKLLVKSVLNNQDSTISEIFRFYIEPAFP